MTLLDLARLLVTVAIIYGLGWGVLTLMAHREDRRDAQWEARLQARDAGMQRR